MPRTWLQNKSLNPTTIKMYDFSRLVTNSSSNYARHFPISLYHSNDFENERNRIAIHFCLRYYWLLLYTIAHFHKNQHWVRSNQGQLVFSANHRHRASLSTQSPLPSPSYDFLSCKWKCVKQIYTSILAPSQYLTRSLTSVRLSKPNYE